MWQLYVLNNHARNMVALVKILYLHGKMRLMMHGLRLPMPAKGYIYQTKTSTCDGFVLYSNNMKRVISHAYFRYECRE